ncbi:MAG: HD-GYP domain-containing protein [Candidatus Marinimicrobia bacterium]|nr:HD-GYP domain-containing protein [Candidatus Neomarinimicrobiota bacterium]
MRTKIKTEDLQTGMFIEISGRWFSHPFLSSQFKISSPKEIDKLEKAGITEVYVDFSKSDSKEENPPSEKKIKPMEPSRDHSESFDGKIKEKFYGMKTRQKSPENERVYLQIAQLSEDLKEKISDTKIPVKERSRIVYSSSVNMMKNLLQAPSRENIQEFKNSAEEIVSFIMKNDDVTHYLLNITDFDHYTYTHSVNVGLYSILLAKTMFGNSSGHDMKKLGAGFFLHDLGKVRIDNRILNKNGKLSAEEYEHIKSHVIQGYELLKETDHLTDEAKVIVLQHHERYQGNGYPYGLKGDEIHLYSKICAIADIFDAFTSNRPYRKPLSAFDALKKMKEEMMEHFQEEIFNQFVLLFKN